MTGVAKPTITKTNPLLLSLRDHREIIVVYKRGESLLTIAERFGVACADVQRIVARVGDLGRILADGEFNAGRGGKVGVIAESSQNPTLSRLRKPIAAQK
jgi:hypothetical protein